MRELDPSVEDDPYFLLSLGLALAMGTFEEAGASELERAAQALQGSDPAAAAQATITRGEYVWQRGDQDGAFAYFDRARALAENAPLSSQKLYVVSQVSRFLALAGRYEEARGEVEQAIAMAEELGDDELLGDSLNNRAVVYASLGDPRWEEDSTRSIEIALRTNSFRATRAYINYGSNLVDTAGDLARAETVTREGLALGRKLGLGSHGDALDPHEPRRDDLSRRELGGGAGARRAGDRERPALRAAGRVRRSSWNSPLTWRRPRRGGGREERSATRVRFAIRRRSIPRS